MRALLLLLVLCGTARAAEIELLHNTNAEVAVSSQVDNTRIRPMHLLDGDTRTAWNSRTGDLVGAWIAFRVPAEAHVTAIKLIVGNTGSGPEGDYFVLNHRIKRVRITREGTQLGEFALDPEQRGLQTIAIDQPGGAFRVEVLETVPGTRATWREICVSELEVWGSLPAPMKPRPRTFDVVSVGVGALRPPRLQLSAIQGPFSDVADLCAKRQCKPGNPRMGPTWHVTATSPILEAQVVRKRPLLASRTSRDDGALVLRTAAGWWLASDPDWATLSELEWPVTIDQLAISGNTVMLTITRRGSAGDHATVTLLCGVGTSAPRCLTPIRTSTSNMRTVEMEEVQLTRKDDWLSVEAKYGFYTKQLTGDYHLTW